MTKSKNQLINLTSNQLKVKCYCELDCQIDITVTQSHIGWMSLTLKRRKYFQADAQKKGKSKTSEYGFKINEVDKLYLIA